MGYQPFEGESLSCVPSHGFLGVRSQECFLKEGGIAHYGVIGGAFFPLQKIGLLYLDAMRPRRLFHIALRLFGGFRVNLYSGDLRIVSSLRHHKC